MKKPLTFIIASLFSLSSMSQTQQEMNNTAFKEYKKEDEEMAKMYKKVMSTRNTKESKNLLLEAQRAWIKYKEAHCKSVADIYEGGSMAPLVYYSCLTELTIERKARLKSILEY